LHDHKTIAVMRDPVGRVPPHSPVC
jgi:hypothetical protein